MKMITMKTAAILTTLFLSNVSIAFASAHLWHIQEVYTNSDGSVQFVEFFTTGTDEFFLSGAQLDLEINGLPVKTFDFLSNLTGNSTADRAFLVATPDFATLFGIAPDYVLPANFLSAGGGVSLHFIPGFDRISLSSLPTDGVRSLNALVSDHSPFAFELNSKATPRNFAGQEVTIPEPSTALLAAAGVLGGLVKSRRRNAL